MADRTRDVLWADAADIYRRICAHPFVAGLADGSLSRNRFGYYVAQDVHYLRGYARALDICAAKAPDATDAAMFAEHAGQAITAERQLHAGLLAELGLGGTESPPVAPTTHAYVSYLLATCHGGCYADAVAAVLPCYWIYARVSERLQAHGSPDPLYQRWIEMYAGPQFREACDAVLAVTDRVGAQVSNQQLALMRRHFRTAARYEWMFWDAAYRMEDWPV